MEKIYDIIIIESTVHLYSISVLQTLLLDRTTRKNIIWADDEYESLGEDYGPKNEIKVEKIYELYKVKDLKELTEEKHANIMANLEKIKAKE